MMGKAWLSFMELLAWHSPGYFLLAMSLVFVVKFLGYKGGMSKTILSILSLLAQTAGLFLANG
jgi:hypothetical protein